MPYIDSNYYLKIYKGRNDYNGKYTSESDILYQSIERASDKIDFLIGFKIKSQADQDALHPFQLEQLKKATAALTEYYIINGGQTAIESDSDLESVSIGEFSLSKSAKNKIPNIVFEHLSHTGLLYSGINTSWDTLL